MRRLSAPHVANFGTISGKQDGGNTMVRKKLILADKDEMYLNNLANFFMEKSPQLDLITFSRQDRLAEYLGC